MTTPTYLDAQRVQTLPGLAAQGTDIRIDLLFYDGATELVKSTLAGRTIVISIWDDQDTSTATKLVNEASMTVNSPSNGYASYTLDAAVNVGTAGKTLYLVVFDTTADPKLAGAYLLKMLPGSLT